VLDHADDRVSRVVIGLLFRLVRLVPVVAVLVLLWPHARPLLHDLHVPSPASLPGIDALARTPHTGPSVTLGPVTKRGGCRIDGALPDHGCTPGARFRDVNAALICRPGYARSVRNVSRQTKNQVYSAYGMSQHFNGRDGELDHLVSLELGGSNSMANLFPEASTPAPGAQQKDRLENRLHDEVCSGQTTLRSAQRLIAGDWVAAYHQRLG
jgi:hypothetical protein